jgi:PAS domain-containing protein
VIAILQDIGTQRETDEALNLVSARLLAVTESSPIAMMMRRARRHELANDAFVNLLGLKSAAQSLSGLRAEDVIAKRPKPAVARAGADHGRRQAGRRGVAAARQQRRR